MSANDDDEVYAPSLQNIIDNPELKWVFVGGKGGVGKSSTSSSLAVELSKHRESVLILSLDPAHNLSDAFNQKFSSEPTLVDGFNNLFAMEIDPKKVASDDQSNPLNALFDGQSLGGSSGLSEIISSVPGIDEASALLELMKQVSEQDYSVIVFDTAPTGHTLNLLRAPGTVLKMIEKLHNFRDKFGGIFDSVATLMGGNGGGTPGDTSSPASTQGIFEKIDEMSERVELIKQHFEDPAHTTFICVSIPEFLSIFETERLVQELTNLSIDCQNIVVNQILFPDECSTCRKCIARQKMQGKYLDQIDLLYGGFFHVVKMPLLDQEIRGKDSLEIFGQMLVTGEPNPLALSDLSEDAVPTMGE